MTNVNAGEVSDVRIVVQSYVANVMLSAICERRGTRFDVQVTRSTVLGDVLTLVNFRRSMPLPEHWSSMYVGYVEEKLDLGEVDAESILLFLNHAAQMFPGD